MGTQGPGRKRIPNRDKSAAEEDALSQIAREAEARSAAKRAARAEAREIRMKESERQQKELFHSTKKYYGSDNKWGHIEQWMEDSERYSRSSRRHTSISDDEERMSVGSRGSYRPSDYGGLSGSSSRASSRASSARASPVVEERTDREFVDKGSRTASTSSAATSASSGGASSRRGSCDTSFSVETEASIREMKDSSAEAEEKYRRAMVSNAQLHNEKTTSMFQVENSREELSDMEESSWEARRRGEDASKESQRERQAHGVSKVRFKETEDASRQSQESSTNHGVAVPPDSSTNGEQPEDGAASRLAEDSLQTGSTLGKASEPWPAEGSKAPPTHPKDKNANSAGDPTRPSRERRNPAERHPGRNRQPRSKAGDPSKKLPFRVDANEVHKKQPGRDGSGESVQKVFRSRLVPPRRASEMISDHRAIALGLCAAGRSKSSSEETMKQDVSSVTSSSEANSDMNGMGTSDSGSQSPEEDMDEEDKGPGVSEEGLSTKPQLESDESKVESVGSEKGPIRRTEAKSETSIFTSSSSESLGKVKVQNQRGPEPSQEPSQVHPARPESPARTSPFVPEEVWSSLETTVQDLLSGSEDKPGFVVEMSRIFSEISICLHQWLSDSENSSSSRAGNGQNDGARRESLWPVMGSRLFMKTWLDSAGLTREAPDGPGSGRGHLVGRVRSTSEMLDVHSGFSHQSSSASPNLASSSDRGATRSRTRDSQGNAESGAGPAGPDCSPPGSPVQSPSAEFVFVDSYFADPRKNSTGSRSDLSSGKRSDSPTRPVSAQSSPIRRFMEVTAEELRALAVPESASSGSQAGRRSEESAGAGSVDESSAGDMDSCEEADEEEEEVQQSRCMTEVQQNRSVTEVQRPLPHQQSRCMTEVQQNRSVTEVQQNRSVTEVQRPLSHQQNRSSVDSGRGEPDPEHEGTRLDSRKSDGTDCRIS